MRNTDAFEEYRKASPFAIGTNFVLVDTISYISRRRASKAYRFHPLLLFTLSVIAIYLC